MTRFSARPSRSVTGIAVGIAALALIALGGCEDKHIGRPCCLNADCTVTAQPTNVSVNSEALECPSRVCILPNQQKDSNGTGPFCTDSCSSDDDCADGETRAGGDAGNDTRCATGFVCRVVIPNLANVALSCQKVCTCKDFLDTNSNTKPLGCS